MVIQNTIQNLPLAIGLSVTAAATGGNLSLSLHLLSNVALGFVLACLLSIILPVQRMSAAVAGWFHQDPNSLAGRAISNVPMSFLFTAIIGLVMSFYNVPVFPTFIFALISSFIPLFIVCYIIAFIVNPISVKVALNAEKK